jgi:hypothetical protein
MVAVPISNFALNRKYNPSCEYWAQILQLFRVEIVLLADRAACRDQRPGRTKAAACPDEPLVRCVRGMGCLGRSGIAAIFGRSGSPKVSTRSSAEVGYRSKDGGLTLSSRRGEPHFEAAILPRPSSRESSPDAACSPGGRGEVAVQSGSATVFRHLRMARRTRSRSPTLYHAAAPA